MLVDSVCVYRTVGLLNTHCLITVDWVLLEIETNNDTAALGLITVHTLSAVLTSGLRYGQQLLSKRHP